MDRRLNTVSMSVFPQTNQIPSKLLCWNQETKSRVCIERPKTHAEHNIEEKKQSQRTIHIQDLV